jgi:predicted AAA+ superfamily ATPase
MEYLERTLRSVIEETDKGARVILLTGQRQVGKSTLFQNMAKSTKRKYVSLDDMRHRILAQTDPALFLQQNPPPILIDEVQYAPDLFPYIKIYADENPDHTGAFWLTGSQKYRLMEGIHESLAGRICILDLFGLSYREKSKNPFSSKPFLPSMDSSNDGKKLTINDIYKLIWEGSLPEPVLRKTFRGEKYYNSYVQSYIERDVKDFYKLEKPLQFFNFLTFTAAQTGQLLNYNSLARDVDIDVKTAQSWMGILERSGMVYLLQPYFPNITKRLIKTPKIYFLDTGLCCFLTKWNTPDSLMNGAMAGFMLETYVLAEILKSYHHNGKTPAIFFYRDKDQKEIDFLLEENGTLYPIEIKRTANPTLKDCNNFKLLEKMNKQVGLGAILCLQPERFPLSREVVSIPVWEI